MLLVRPQQPTVQLTIQIFGDRKWWCLAVPSPQKKHRNRRLRKGKGVKDWRNKSPLPREDKCWNAHESCSMVHKWFMIDCPLHPSPGIFHMHCQSQVGFHLHIEIHRARLVGWMHRKNIKPPSSFSILIKTIPHGPRILACKIIITFDNQRHICQKDYWFLAYSTALPSQFWQSLVTLKEDHTSCHWHLLASWGTRIQPFTDYHKLL